MRAHLFCFLTVACWFLIGAHKAVTAEPVSYRQAAALSPAEQDILNRKAERGDSKAAFALALYYAIVAPNLKNREYFLTLASKSGSRESSEALADFYSMPGGIFQMQKAISLRKDLKRNFPNEIDNIAWAEGLAFEYHYRTTEEARRKELAFLKLADSWGSAKAKGALQSMDAHGTSSTKTSKVVDNVREPMRPVGINDSLPIPAEKIRVLKRKAAQGDSQAAEKLSLYYRVYRNDKKKELRYLKLGARGHSAVAVRNLMTIYCTDPGLFNFEKALGFRQQLKQMAETKAIDVQPDVDWSYDLYIEHFWSAGHKSRGVRFLKYAANHDSEKARNELIEIYSKDPNLRNPEKARYWEQKSVGAKPPTTQTLALIGNTAEQLPAVVARSSVANARSKQAIQFLLSVSQEKPNSEVLALQLILVNTSRVLQDLSKTGKISVTCKVGRPTLYVPGQYIGITRSLEPQIAAVKLEPGKWVAQEIALQPELSAEEIAEISASCEIGGVAYKSNTIYLSEK